MPYPLESLLTPTIPMLIKLINHDNLLDRMPNRKKILMISFHTAQNLGLRSIASNLKGHVVHYLYLVNLVNIFVKTKQNNIPLACLQKFAGGYDYIFISSTSYNKKEVFLISDLIKSKYPKMKILIGGNIAMFEAEECLLHADYVCIWEGHTISELLSQIESGKKNISVANFISKENKTARLSLPKNLDDLPLPDYSSHNHFFLYKNKIIKKEFSPKTITFRTTISCIYSSNFLSENYLNRLTLENDIPPYKEISIEKVMTSLIALKKTTRNAKLIRIVDYNFLSRKLDDIRYFAQQYNQHINLPLMIDADQRSKDFLEKFRAIAGIKSTLKMTFEIHTGSEELNARVYKNRQKNSASISNHAKMLEILNFKKTKMKLIYAFTYLNPIETKKDILATINLMLKLPKASFVICSLTLMPNTKLKERLSDHYEELDHQGELKYRYFKRYAFYYAMYFFIKILNVIRLNTLLPKQLKQNRFTEFMNSPIFSPLYYVFIKSIYLFYELEIKIKHRLF